MDSDCECPVALDFTVLKVFGQFIGEQSLGVGTFCVNYKDCFNSTSQDLMSDVTSGSTDADYNNFYRALWESQYHAYNHGAGFIFWNWCVSDRSCMSPKELIVGLGFRKAISPVWSYEQSVTQNWIPVDMTDTLCVGSRY